MNIKAIVKKQKALFAVVIFVVVVAVGIVGYFIFKEATTPKSPLLPDIKFNQPYTESKTRNEILAKVTPKLPYKDDYEKIVIEYYPKTKDISVRILTGDTKADYLRKKKLAEAKLKEFGADNLCYLLIFWSPPPKVIDETTKADVTTTGCQM